MNIPEEAVEAAARAGDPEAWNEESMAGAWGRNAGVHMRLAQSLARTRARAALEAAWSVMHPVLTTAEELDALADGINHPRQEWPVVAEGCRFLLACRALEAGQ